MTDSTNAAAAGELLASPPRAALSPNERQRDKERRAQEREKLAAEIAELREFQAFVVACERLVSASNLREVSPTCDCRTLTIGQLERGAAYAFRSSLLASPPARLVVVIDSNGGFITEGKAIAQMIQSGPWFSVAQIKWAASAATIVAMTCDRRAILPTGRMMFHSYYDFENGSKIFCAEDRDDIEQVASSSYVTPRQLAEWVSPESGDVFLDAAEALRLGLVHSIEEFPC